MTTFTDSGFTEAQHKAIHTLDRPLVTTAGPGAGKTKVLVGRYLEILSRPGVDVDNIVAITFTTKAANEMRDRVRKGIDVKILDHRGTAAEQLWRERKRRLESGVITTIHGFCSRLLREYPIDAGVDPRFAILDEYTSMLMLDLAAEQAVTTIINAGADAGAHLVAAYGRGALVKELGNLYTHLRGLGVDIDAALQATERSLLTVADYRERLAAARVRVAELAAATEVKGKAREKIDELLEAWERALPELQADPTPDRAVDLLALLERLRAAMPTAQSKAIKETVHALRALLGGRDEGAGHLAAAFFDCCAWDYLPIVFQALRSIDFLYSDAKRAAQALDYEDLQLFVRALLKRSPEVRKRAAARYRYFLVDEFQDTNRLQREIISLLTLESGNVSAEAQNLFIVGDRKQSIYNFRGAEVEVFEEAIRDVTDRGGELVLLDVNFRSDARLVTFFNGFFEKLMRLESGEDAAHFAALGFVGYEPGTAHRGALAGGPAVDLLLHTPDEDAEPAKSDDDTVRDIEARRLAAHIRRIVDGGEPIVRGADGEPRPARYKDFAMLLGAFTHVKTYEQAFQQARVPYYVVAGRGFYSRPEVLDLLTLLEFLDNRTDEICLAAVLRSPLFGISDDTLYLLRWGKNGDGGSGNGKGGNRPMPLFHAVLEHDAVPGIDERERKILAEARDVLTDLLSVRNRLPLSRLLERAIRVTQYDLVAAAATDGAQKLSNIEKLVLHARSFEKKEARLLRDFVEYIRDFRRLDAREAEAQLELGLDAVAVMTVHKSKGLEFPIVVLPDLQHKRRRNDDVFLFDRDRGLAFRVPDRRGGTVATALFGAIGDRMDLRAAFESMRQLYVGMTRAEDRLILSAAVNRAVKPNDRVLREQDSWLAWLQRIVSPSGAAGESIATCGDAEVRVLGREADLALPEADEMPEELLVETPKPAFAQRAAVQARDRQRQINALLSQMDRQMSPVPATSDVPSALHYRFSVTQLVNYLNCPRQYYFARLLQMPETELRPGMADEAETDDTPSRLSPSLRGTVIHRFCEILKEGDDPDVALRQALADVRTRRAEEWPDELARLDEDAALRDLAPLARNYVKSDIRREVDERWRAGLTPEARRNPARHPFVKSELGFLLRTEAAAILGSVDKLLVTPDGDGIRVHVVDFKTNLLWANRTGFEAELAEKAAMYRIQMQAYALAAWWLLPNVKQVAATLHFLHPNRAYSFPSDQLTEDKCRREIVAVAQKLRSLRALDSAEFSANPGARCLNCRFAEVCADAVRLDG